jgi:outer membrane protein assembly factor BamB
MRIFLFIISGVFFLSPHLRGANQWPTWRGPNADGTVTGCEPPTQWSATQNIKWKVKLPGSGSSTPIIWDEKLFLLLADSTGKQASPEAIAKTRVKIEGAPPLPTVSNPEPKIIHRFDVLCIDRTTGKFLWRKTAREELPHEGHHRDHGYASSSPVTDGKHLYINYGSRGVHCYTLEGKPVWSRGLGKMTTRRHYGEGSSPALHGNTLIVNWDHEEQSFIIALDKRTGKTLWKKDRDEITSWATPLVIVHEGTPQVIVSGTNRVRSYEIKTGKVLWECGGQTVNVIPSPVHGLGNVYVASGYRGRAVYAIKLGNKGDLTGTEAITWEVHRSTPYIPSPLLHQKRLYFFSANQARLSCYDAADGKPNFVSEPIEGLFGVYASPVATENKIFVTGRSGNTAVVTPSAQLKVERINKLGEPVDASPAIVGNEIYIRSRAHLYCIADTKTSAPSPTFTPSSLKPELTASVELSDLDNDGDLDVLVANGRHWGGPNRAYYNNGKGAFTRVATIGTGKDRSYAARALDYNGDGLMDVAIANDRQQSRIYLGQKSRKFTLGPAIGPAIQNTRNLTITDLDGDMRPDILIANRRAANFIYDHTPKGDLAKGRILGSGADSTIDIAIGDVNGDGRPDAVLANRDGQPNTVYLNGGNKKFGKAIPYGTGRDNTRSVALADINGDGHLDIIAANVGQPNRVFYNDGKGTFTRSTAFGGAQAPSYSVAAADLDQDGDTDIVIGNAGQKNVVYLNEDKGSRFRSVSFGQAAATYCVELGDLNGDKYPDIVTGNSGTHNYVYLNVGKAAKADVIVRRQDYPLN